jgi:hypothetical protein
VAAQPIEIVTSTSGDACDVSNYLRRRRPRIDPLAWGRFRVRVRGVLPWKRLFASLSRSRNLSAAVLLLSLFIVDPFDATQRSAPSDRGESQGNLGRLPLLRIQAFRWGGSSRESLCLYDRRVFLDAFDQWSAFCTTKVSRPGSSAPVR